MSKEPTKKKRRKGVLPPRREGWRWRPVSLAGVAEVRLGALVNFIIGVCLAAVFVLGMVFLLYREQKTGNPSPETAADVTQPDLPVEPFGPESEGRLERVLSKHAEATGLAAVQSLVLSGRYMVGGRTYETDFILKRPDKIRHVVKQEGYQTIRVFDGRELGMGVYDTDGNRIGIPPEAVWASAFSLIAEGSFGLLAWNHMDRTEGYRVEPMGAGKVGDVDCMQLTSIMPVGTKMDHLLDPLTGREIARRVLFTEDGGQKIRVIEVELSDFMDIDGVEIPMHYSMRLDGEDLVEVQLETVRKNVGVLPSIFKLAD